MIRVLFVCTGNICRSTMAEAYFRHLVHQAGLSDQIKCDSAGTSNEEEGNPINPNTQEVLRQRNIPFEMHYARPLRQTDYTAFDYLLGMTDTHIYALRERAPAQPHGVIQLFLRAANRAGVVKPREVPDPWGHGFDKYQETFQLVAPGCQALLSHLRTGHQL